MKKRKMKVPAWKPRPTQTPVPAPQAAPSPDMAVHVLRLALMRSCADFARETAPLLREMGALGERLDVYVRRVRDMPEAELKAGLQGIGKGRAMLRILRRLVADVGAVVEEQGVVTPAPGVERKQ